MNLDICHRVHRNSIGTEIALTKCAGGDSRRTSRNYFETSREKYDAKMQPGQPLWQRSAHPACLIRLKRTRHLPSVVLALSASADGIEIWNFVEGDRNGR
jgi:hypothetical protein